MSAVPVEEQDLVVAVLGGGLGFAVALGARVGQVGELGGEAMLFGE